MIQLGIGLIVAMFLPYAFETPRTPHASFVTIGCSLYIGYLIGLLIGLLLGGLKKRQNPISGPK